MLFDAMIQLTAINQADPLATFTGIGPDGQPATFTIPDGRFWHYECLSCGCSVGGGVEIPKHPAPIATSDPYDPTNRPCIRCGGDVIAEYDD